MPDGHTIFNHKWCIIHEDTSLTISTLSKNAPKAKAVRAAARLKSKYIRQARRNGAPGESLMTGLVFQKFSL